MGGDEKFELVEDEEEMLEEMPSIVDFLTNQIQMLSAAEPVLGVIVGPGIEQTMHEENCPVADFNATSPVPVIVAPLVPPWHILFVGIGNADDAVH